MQRRWDDGENTVKARRDLTAHRAARRRPADFFLPKACVLLRTCYVLKPYSKRIFLTLGATCTSQVTRARGRKRSLNASWKTWLECG
jgi:hypothetical protein